MQGSKEALLLNQKPLRAETTEPGFEVGSIWFQVHDILTSTLDRSPDIHVSAILLSSAEG